MWKASPPLCQWSTCSRRSVKQQRWSPRNCHGTSTAVVTRTLSCEIFVADLCNIYSWGPAIDGSFYNRGTRISIGRFFCFFLNQLVASQSKFPIPTWKTQHCKEKLQVPLVFFGEHSPMKHVVFGFCCQNHKRTPTPTIGWEVSSRLLRKCCKGIWRPWRLVAKRIRLRSFSIRVSWFWIVFQGPA